MPLTPYPAFVSGYQSALAVSDLITAVLLLAQLAVQRSRGLLLLACGYLFTAGAAIVHALTFPGLFSPSGLLGAGPQTTVWLFMIWHAVFPLCVLAYAQSKPTRGDGELRGSGTTPILAGIVAVILALAVCTWIVTAQHQWLPILLHEGRYTPVMIGVVTTVWSLSSRSAGGAAVPQALVGARHLADGRDVRLAVRHRTVGRAQHGPGSILASISPHLRALRGEFRARGPAGPHRHPAGPPCRTAGDGAP